MKDENILNKIEITFEGWFKPLPHLPENGRKWIASNAGVIVTIGLILSVIGALFTIGTLLTVLSFFGSFMGAIGVAVYSSGVIVSTIVSLLSMVLAIALMAMAIKPLKAMDKRGWDLLFLLSLAGATLSVVSAVINFDVFSLLGGLIGAAIGLAIGMYFLFEIRSYFEAKPKANKALKTPQAAK